MRPCATAPAPALSAVAGSRRSSRDWRRRRRKARGSLLAVHEADDGGHERRGAIDHGDQLLDQLRELRLALVDGWVSEADLHRLAHLIERAGPEIDDRGLAPARADIEPPAAVELARLQRRGP